MEVRKAVMGDIGRIYELVNHYAEKGLVLPRSRHSIFESVRDFSVAVKDGDIIGVGALSLALEGLAEIRALAISPDHLNANVGSSLVEAMQQEALQIGLDKLFVLTYHPEFFRKAGFREIGKEELPHKVWRDCINCTKFPNCDETAMMQDLLIQKSSSD